MRPRESLGARAMLPRAAGQPLHMGEGKEGSVGRRVSPLGQKWQRCFKSSISWKSDEVLSEGRWGR